MTTRKTITMRTKDDYKIDYGNGYKNENENDKGTQQSNRTKKGTTKTTTTTKIITTRTIRTTMNLRRSLTRSRSLFFESKTLRLPLSIYLKATASSDTEKSEVGQHFMHAATP
jgi:hypothetical protein